MFLEILQSKFDISSVFKTETVDTSVESSLLFKIYHPHFLYMELIQTLNFQISTPSAL